MGRGAKTTGQAQGGSAAGGGALRPAGFARSAKAKHKRQLRRTALSQNAQGLVAKPPIQPIKSKHQSYFEFVENKDKKKKLEFQLTTDIEPPPGFEFVPIGNLGLTTACKELSRDQDALVFIVSDCKLVEAKIDVHVTRIGHHIRQAIVEQARATLENDDFDPSHLRPGQPEPIPKDTHEVLAQADAMIRALFPRIPHTDRVQILRHSFTKSHKVGLAANIPLARRVSLAVYAHIRHTHTRYDQILKEGNEWVDARKAVEDLCLEYLVKWRGDDENGRDDLDEILREVVVISDSESDDEDEDNETGVGSAASSSESDSVQEICPSAAKGPLLDSAHGPVVTRRQRRRHVAGRDADDVSKRSHLRLQRKPRRSMHKYHNAWNQAKERLRADGGNVGSPGRTAVNESPGYGLQNPSARCEMPASTFVRPHGPGLRHRHPDSVERTIHYLDPVPGIHRETNNYPQLSRPPEPYIPVPGFMVTEAEAKFDGHPRRLRTLAEPPGTGSPVRQNLQDLLVQSIESPSPDAALPPRPMRTIRDDVARYQGDLRPASPVHTHPDFAPASVVDHETGFVRQHVAPAQYNEPLEVIRGHSQTHRHQVVQGSQYDHGYLPRAIQSSYPEPVMNYASGGMDMDAYADGYPRSRYNHPFVDYAHSTAARPRPVYLQRTSDGTFQELNHEPSPQAPQVLSVQRVFYKVPRQGHELKPSVVRAPQFMGPGPLRGSHHDHPVDLTRTIASDNWPRPAAFGSGVGYTPRNHLHPGDSNYNRNLFVHDSNSASLSEPHPKYEGSHRSDETRDPAAPFHQIHGRYSPHYATMPHELPPAAYPIQPVYR